MNDSPTKKQTKFELVSIEPPAKISMVERLRKNGLILLIAAAGTPILGYLVYTFLIANPDLIRNLGAFCTNPWFPAFMGVMTILCYGIPPLFLLMLTNIQSPNPTHLIITRHQILALKVPVPEQDGLFTSYVNSNKNIEINTLAGEHNVYNRLLKSSRLVVAAVWWKKISRVSAVLEKNGARMLCFHAHNGKIVKMRLGDVLGNESRIALLEGLKTHAADAVIEPEAYELLSPLAETSYTELWISALSAPPSMKRMAPLSDGATIGDGRYKILSQMGAGGQATVYLASTETEQAEPMRVVVKEYILPIGVTRAATKSAIETLEREAKLLTKLTHPQIVKVIDFFIEDHRGFLVFELVAGDNLRSIVQRKGAMSELEASKIGAQLCRILTYLHDQEPPIIHQDVSPDNIILQQDGEVKLIDFAIAQQNQNTLMPSASGKRAYMPPEQFRGKPTPQSDLYALGCTLHFLVTAEDPEPLATCHPQIIKPRANLSDTFDLVVSMCTQLETATRYQTADEMRMDLDSLQQKLNN